MAAAPAAKPPAAPAAAAKPRRPASSSPRPRKDFDVLGELEKLSRQVTSIKPRGKPAAPPTPAAAAPQPNGHGEHQRNILVTIDPVSFRKVRRLSLNLQMEDENHQVIDVARGFHIDIQDPKSLEKVLLKLNIALSAKK